MALITSERVPNAPREYDQKHMNTLSRILAFVLRKLDFDTYRLGSNETPATTSAIGVVGDIKHDADYIYVCTDTDTWKRATLTTW